MTDLMGALGNLVKSAGNEVSRGWNEMQENVVNDVKQIEGGVKNGGFVGGAIEAADVFSPGHQAANMLDSWNVIPENAAIKEGISAAVNFASLGPAQLVAFKDAAEAIGHFQAATGTATASAEAQCAMTPEQARARAKEAAHACAIDLADAKVAARADAKAAAHAAALEKARENAARGGWCPSDDCAWPSKPGDSLRKIIREHAALERKIDQILANPNLCFEDMIFLLMRTVMKLAREEVKGFKDELKGLRAEDKKGREAGDDRADAKDRRATLLENRAQRSNDPGDIEAARAARADAKSSERDIGQQLSDKSEARADAFEELKLMMQRLSEMEQALSNVLNTMHESAMGAIRNIR